MSESVSARRLSLSLVRQSRQQDENIQKHSKRCPEVWRENHRDKFIQTISDTEHHRVPENIEGTIAFLENQIKAKDRTGIIGARRIQEADGLAHLPQRDREVTSVTALVIATVEFTCFDNARQLTCHQGFPPTYRQSGTPINVKGNINQNGDSALRRS